MSTNLLRTFVSLLLEESEDAPMGLSLPDVRDAGSTRGDDTSGERAMMRLRTKEKKYGRAIDRLDKKSRATKRSKLRADAASSDTLLSAAVDSGKERSHRAVSKTQGKRLDRALSTGNVDARTANDVIGKVTDDKNLRADAVGTLRGMGVPNVNDTKRDIAIASAERDEDGEQTQGLTDLVRSIVNKHRDALNLTNVTLDIEDEIKKQSKSGVRS